jgi:hypothetical protein
MEAIDQIFDDVPNGGKLVESLIVFCYGMPVTFASMA